MRSGRHVERGARQRQRRVRRQRNTFVFPRFKNVICFDGGGGGGGSPTLLLLCWGGSDTLAAIASEMNQT